jgi:hypothetical protein
MVKKVLLVSVLGFILISFVGNQAWAAVTCPPECTFKTRNGIYCGYPSNCIQSGGVWTTLLGYGLGNVFKEGDEVLLGIKVTTLENANFAVVCSNNGGNIAPGASPVPSLEPTSTEAFTIVDATFATKNGRVEATVHATPTQDILDALEYAATSAGIEACPNDQNWYFSDAVPCDNMNLILQQREFFEDGTQTCVTADAVYSCTLVDDNGDPSCSVEIDPSTKELVAKGFLCQEVESNTYSKTPIDCQAYP